MFESTSHLSSGIDGAFDAFIASSARDAMAPAESQRQKLARLSLEEFVPALTPRWKRPSHLRKMLDLFERAERESVFACVSVPPRHGKTETILHQLVRRMTREPGIPLAYASYGAEFVRSKSRLARDYARAAGLVLRPDAAALGEWVTTDGSLLAVTGRGGPLTGKGFRQIVVDDPFKNREEAESKLIRDRAWEWLTSTVLTRLEKDERQVYGSVFVVHTRWHDDDMIGRCEKERDKWIASGGEEGHPWEIVSLQALDEQTGEALWPERYSAADLGKIRRLVGEYDWHSLYQQKPRPRGARVFGLPARCSAPEVNGARFVIGVDVAITKKSRSNWTIAVVLAVHGYGEEMRADVVEVRRWQEELPVVCRELRSLQQTYQAPLAVEASGVGRAVPQTMLDTDPHLWIVPIETSQDKFLRAQPVAAAWNAGRVRVRVACDAQTAEFLRVVCGFTGISDKEDDDPDALAHAWNYALRSIMPTGHAHGAGESPWQRVESDHDDGGWS